MKKQSISKLLSFILVMPMLLFTQCDIADSIDRGVDQFRLFREQAVYEINTASQLIAGGVGGINDVLENLNESLPKEIHKTLSFDVPFIIDVVAAELASVGLCFTDAAASKALYLLELMKSEIITGEEVPLPDPFICITSVPAINLNQDKNQREILEFTGYNLFQEREFTAALFNAAGDSIPVPVNRPTSYRIAVNISDFEDNILEKFKYLSLYYEENPISSLFVVRKNQEPPVSKTIVPRPVPGPMGVYPLSNYQDKYFGADCRVYAKITFGYNSKKAWVDLYMTVEELTEDGKTYAKGFADRNVYYTAPQGWHIKKMTGQKMTDYHIYKDITNEDDVRYTLFGQLTVSARNSTAGATTRGILNFGPNVPDIVIESDE